VAGRGRRTLEFREQALGRAGAWRGARGCSGPQIRARWLSPARWARGPAGGVTPPGGTLGDRGPQARGRRRGRRSLFSNDRRRCSWGGEGATAGHDHGHNCRHVMTGLFPGRAASRRAAMTSWGPHHVLTTTGECQLPGSARPPALPASSSDDKASRRLRPHDKLLPSRRLVGWPLLHALSLLPAARAALRRCGARLAGSVWRSLHLRRHLGVRASAVAGWSFAAQVASPAALPSPSGAHAHGDRALAVATRAGAQAAAAGCPAAASSC
jgi:hypothetical protein